jgi:hypothetical protein
MLDLVTRMTAVEAEEAIRKDPKLTCLAKLPTEDLRSFCEIAVQSISIWDAGEDLPASAHCFHQLGRFGEHHGIPVTEIVWALKLIQAEPREDVETLVDVARYYIIRGYEDASR